MFSKASNIIKKTKNNIKYRIIFQKTENVVVLYTFVITIDG